MKTRRQVNEAAFRKARRKQAQIRGAKPARNKRYREWIATLPCVVSCPNILGMLSIAPFSDILRSDCSHVGDTGRGMAQKCSDYETVPMSRARHEEYHKIGREAFEALHGVDLLQIAADLRKRFLEYQG